LKRKCRSSIIASLLAAVEKSAPPFRRRLRETKLSSLFSQVYIAAAKDGVIRKLSPIPGSLVSSVATASLSAADAAAATASLFE